MPPRDLKGPTRKAVANPFEESVRQKAYKGAGGYVSDRGPNRAQFQTAQPVDDATDIVEGLLSFAGVAGDAIGKKLDKKISEDRIIQTQQAVLGLNPTSEATNAGYEAHMAVGVKNEQIKAQTKLNELAQGNYTDEEWQQVIRDVYSEGDKNLANRYPDYNSRTEVQKLMALGMAEMMPQVTAEREAAKMGQEIEGRIQTEIDIIISSLKAGQDPTFLLQQSEKRMSAMKLTQSQKEGILKTVAEQTGLSGAIEMTKGFKGDRDTTLYERDGSLIELDKGQQRDEAALKAGSNFRIKADVMTAFSQGMTVDTFLRTVDTHNKVHENNPSAQISRSEVAKAIKDRNEAIQDQFVLDAQLRSIAEGRTLYDATPEKRRELLTTAYHRALAKTGQDMAGQPPEAVQKKVAQVTAEYGDLAIKQGVQIPALVMDTKLMLSVNLDADLKSGELLENLPENAERALFQLQSLSPKGLEFHLKAMDDTERKQVLHMMDLMDSGTDPVLALREAQAWNDKYRPVKVKDLDKAEDNLASGLGAVWYNPYTWKNNMPNAQIPYFRSTVRQKLASMPDPTSERAQEQLASWFKNEWTVGEESGTLIQVNKNDLERVGAGIDIGNIERGLEALAFANKDKLLPSLANYGYDESDLDNLIYDVNGQQGHVTFRTPEGDILLRAQSLKGLKSVLKSHEDYLKSLVVKEQKALRTSAEKFREDREQFKPIAPQ